MDDVTWNGTADLDKNATITSLYAGVDYRTTGAVLKVGSNMNVKGDLILDNIVIQSTSSTVPDTATYIHTQDYTNLLIMHYNELAIGRGVTTPGSSYTFGAIIGGEGDCGFECL